MLFPPETNIGREQTRPFIEKSILPIANDPLDETLTGNTGPQQANNRPDWTFSTQATRHYLFVCRLFVRMFYGLSISLDYPTRR